MIVSRNVNRTSFLIGHTLMGVSFLVGYCMKDNEDSCRSRQENGGGCDMIMNHEIYMGAVILETIKNELGEDGFTWYSGCQG